jgi:hypothetical protein
MAALLAASCVRSSGRPVSATISRHRTTVSLTVSDDLRLAGSVQEPDGYSPCRRRTIRVERYVTRWTQVAQTRSASDGTYAVHLSGAADGYYRTVATRARSGDDVCLPGASRIGTFGSVPDPKPLSAGLLRAWTTPPAGWKDVVGGWVPAVTWRELQPKRNRRVDTSAIDALIHQSEREGLTLRLRILAGAYAPRWVKRRFGTVRIDDWYDGIVAAVPRWWVKGYMHTYAELQTVLARRYDDDPVLRAVTVSGAMTIPGEPFIRGIASRITRRNLLAAGYTAKADRRSIRRSIDAQSAWHHTRQIMSFNPWLQLNQDGTVDHITSFTKHVMDRFRSAFGPGAILQNNSIRSSWITGTMPKQIGAMYAHMAALGGPIAFQTARTRRVGDLPTVLQWCVDQGASAVELQADFEARITKAKAQALDAALEANAS